jgi:RNA polymerase sigma-70 factor (ECF subfamily)
MILPSVESGIPTEGDLRASLVQASKQNRRHAHRMEAMSSSAVTVEALEALYRAGLPRFVRTAGAIVGDEASGRDAVQEAFVQAVRKRASFRNEAPLEAWVWRIVINEARALRRRLASELAGSSEPATARSANHVPEQDADVRAWVAALPERQRLAIFLRYFADLDYRSIAAVLEVEVGTVSATLAAAHGALRDSLREVER